MDLKRILLSFTFILVSLLSAAQTKDRWTILEDGSIRWNIHNNIITS